MIGCQKSKKITKIRPGMADTRDVLNFVNKFVKDAIVHGRFGCLGASSEGSAGTGSEPCSTDS
jgi:hypothetical protein